MNLISQLRLKNNGLVSHEKKKLFAQLANVVDWRADCHFKHLTVIACINHHGDNRSTLNPEVTVTSRCVHQLMPGCVCVCVGRGDTDNQRRQNARTHVQRLYDKDNPSLILLS